MPPLPTIEIPVMVRCPDKGKAPVGLRPKARTYNDKPLPVGPSDHAPRNAKIVGRVIEISGVSYQLKIGDVEINHVGVEEILDYVSALELEEYEHRQFEEENEVLKAVEAEREVQKHAKLERMKERAKTKGAVFYETDTGTNDETEGGEEVLGRHGRARPTYTHLFKKVNIPKGKAILPGDDGLLPASDDEDEDSSEQPPQPRPPIVRGPVSFVELPKRRRRKRDRITGELMPLSPVATQSKSQETVTAAPEPKRQRRRRHPLTGELMPIGWRYDPDNEEDTYENRRSGQPPSIRKLSLSQEHEPKRLKLDTASERSRSTSPIPAQPSATKQPSPAKLKPFIRVNKSAPTGSVVDLLSSEDEIETAPAKKVVTPLKSPPKASQTRPSNNNMLQSIALSSAPETSPEPALRPFLPGPSPSKTKTTSPQKAQQVQSPSRPKEPKTSITNPSAVLDSSVDLPIQPSGEEDESEEDVGEDEWFIEAVLAHSLSDPRTHPSSLGDKPVMLYQVKWEGYEEPTWEPVESFTDRSVLNEYRLRNGLPIEPSDDEMENDDDNDPTIHALQQPISQPEDQGAGNEEEVLDEDEYEVEGIVGHHLSDPRTHPSELGKKPVMLYRVKWKGYDELTWEPASSFEDTGIVHAYNKHFGLAESLAASDSDEEMDDAS